jgi:DNA-directed RNA polymerase specialized sigma24 family protein
VLDDTTIREFLRDDYPRIVDAVALVTGDVTGAERSVRGALLAAWTQSETGEPIDALAGWVTGRALRRPRVGVRRRGVDRRARRLLARSAEDEGADVRHALARLSWRHREVAVLHLFLGTTRRETAETLRIRERTVERSLAEARTELAASLQPDDEDATDEALIEQFARAARHREPDPRLFEELVTAMTRRQTTRRARTLALAVSVLALGGGLVALVDRSPHDQATGTPTSTNASGIPADAAALPGVPFPACHVSVTHSFSETGWSGVVYIFGKGSPSVPCLKLSAAQTYLAIDTRGAGRPKDVVVFGPIHCELACRAFATGDIDGDGWAELAVVVADRPRADTIELYRVRPDALTPVRQITTVVRGTSLPFSFAWSGAGPLRSGAACSGARHADLDVWRAKRRDGVWHQRETFYELRGASIEKVGGALSTTPDGSALPETGDFCGMPVGF